MPLFCLDLFASASSSRSALSRGLQQQAAGSRQHGEAVGADVWCRRLVQLLVKVIFAGCYTRKMFLLLPSEMTKRTAVVTWPRLLPQLQGLTWS